MDLLRRYLLISVEQNVLVLTHSEVLNRLCPVYYRGIRLI